MKEKTWFEEWFDSPYYHILYESRNKEEAERFIAGLIRELQLDCDAKVLDVACGKGRHSRTLAKYGFDVTGIDLSKNNIEFARQFETKRLKFDIWDMRCAYKKEEFNYVFNLFSSFGYFDDEDNSRSIQAFADELKKDGMLILDYINTEFAVKYIKPREIIQKENIQFHIQKRIEKGFIKKNIEFLVDGEDHHYEEQLKIINRFKFEEMLHAAGLHIKHIYGDYELEPFQPSLSPRLILVAQKV